MGDTEALQKAIGDGASVDYVDPADPQRLTSLHWAAKCGRPEDVAALLKAGAQVDALNKGGVTPCVYSINGPPPSNTSPAAVSITLPFPSQANLRE